jgi:Ulp1 family protease
MGMVPRIMGEVPFVHVVNPVKPCLSYRVYSSVLRWLPKKKIKINDLDYLFVPINRSSTHWYFAMVDMKSHTISMYDGFKKVSKSLLPHGPTN